MDVSPGERWKIGVLARELGQARELGEYWRCFESSGTSLRAVGGVFLAILGLFAGVPSVVIAAGPGRAVALIVTCALVSAGVALIRSAPRKIDRILLYASGLAQVRHSDVAPGVIHWSRLGHVLKSYSSATDDSDPRLIRISLTGADGTVIAVDEAYGPGSVGQLEREIDPVVTALRLPAAAEQYRARRPVMFGDLSVSRDGIGWDAGSRFASWPDIGAVRVKAHEIQLDVAGRKRPWAIGLDEVPDACVAIRLIKDIATEFGVLRPDAAVARPDGAALISDARTALLSQAEVSQALGWPMRAVPCPTIGKQVCARFEGGGTAVEVKLRRSVRADRAIAGRIADRLPGIGDEAWLLKTQTRLVVRVGTTTALLTIADLPPPARAPTLIHLARIVAGRLAAAPAA